MHWGKTNFIIAEKNSGTRLKKKKQTTNQPLCSASQKLQFDESKQPQLTKPLQHEATMGQEEPHEEMISHPSTKHRRACECR